MGEYYGYTFLAKLMYDKIEVTLNLQRQNKDSLVTLKEIREILKNHRELLWDYLIPNDNGVFYLSGRKTGYGGYLHLEVSHPCLPEGIFIYFDMDITSNAMSINTRNDDLNSKVQRLLRDKYLEQNPYANPHRIPDLSEPLNQIAFERVYLPQMEKEIRKIKAKTGLTTRR